MLLAYFQYKEIIGRLKADIYLNKKDKYICAFFENKNYDLYCFNTLKKKIV